MDPDAALARIRELVSEINTIDPKAAAAAAAELADLVEGLDTWLTNGGFFPAAWAVNREGGAR